VVLGAEATGAVSASASGEDECAEKENSRASQAMWTKL